MILATIRLYETQGQWRIRELGVSDGLGTSQHLWRARETYASEEEALLTAKYQARLRITETWDFDALDYITWDIKTIVHSHELDYPSCL
jgi:hypothetical protein